MAENNKTRFFYVLYSDKTRVFDQSERAYYPIYIINMYILNSAHVYSFVASTLYANCNQIQFVLTNKEALTVLCSVVRHAGSG